MNDLVICIRFPSVPEFPFPVFGFFKTNIHYPNHQSNSLVKVDPKTSNVSTTAVASLEPQDRMERSAQSHPAHLSSKETHQHELLQYALAHLEFDKQIFILTGLHHYVLNWAELDDMKKWLCLIQNVPPQIH